MGDNSENLKKNEHGQNGKKALEQMLDRLKEKEYISDYRMNYHVADPKYEEGQFYFQGLVEFPDDEGWILHSTTSIRDRITEQQWNSEHIKRICGFVKKAYVVVPDELSEKEKAIAQNYDRKIQENKIYSALDGVISFNEAYQKIEQKGAELLGIGSGKAKLGLHFEEKMVDALNYEYNWKIFKGEATTETGYLYGLFLKIMASLQPSFPPKYLSSIRATSDIPKLPGGGSPKADVYMEIKDICGNTYSHAFSCKRSSRDRVSVHEYTADAFCDVLDKQDNELRILLNKFQNAGGERSMSPTDAKRLKEKLARHIEQLNLWVFGGCFGGGDWKTQMADYIVTYNDEKSECSVYRIEEYIEKCYESGIMGQFGTIFQWTYPSGGKGKRIQLKCRVM